MFVFNSVLSKIHFLSFPRTHSYRNRTLMLKTERGKKLDVAVDSVTNNKLQNFNQGIR